MEICPSHNSSLFLTCRDSNGWNEVPFSHWSDIHFIFVLSRVPFERACHDRKVNISSSSQFTHSSKSQTWTIPFLYYFPPSSHLTSPIPIDIMFSQIGRITKKNFSVYKNRIAYRLRNYNHVKTQWWQFNSPISPSPTTTPGPSVDHEFEALQPLGHTSVQEWPRVD